MNKSKKKRIRSLLMAVVMMLTMLPMTAVTAYAAEPGNLGDGNTPKTYQINDLSIDDRLNAGDILLNSTGSTKTLYFCRSFLATSMFTYDGRVALGPLSFPGLSSYTLSNAEPIWELVGIKDDKYYFLGCEIDTTAPTLTAGTVSRTSDTEATVGFNSNESGRYYYEVVASGGAKPTIDTSGAGTACYDEWEMAITLSDLTAGAKDIYIVVKDKSGNVSDDNFHIAIPAAKSNEESRPKKGTVFTSGKYTYIITDEDGAVSMTGLAKGKSVTKVSVSKTVKYKGYTYKVTEIGKSAFYNNKKITSINIGNNVTKIGNKAFANCTKLTTVSIGNKVTTISNAVFYKCTKLKTVTIGTGLKKIGNHVFCHNTKLRTVTIKSNKLTSVGTHNMYKMANTKIKVPSSKVGAYTKLFKKQGQKKSVKVSA